MINFSSIFRLGEVVQSIKSSFKMINFNSLMGLLYNGKEKIKEWLRKIVKKAIEQIKSAILPPKSKKDYIKIFEKYFSKRIVFLCSVIVFVGGYFLVIYAYSWADGNLWRSNTRYGSEKFKTFSGKVNLYNNGTIIYVGEMSEGKISGKGKQYDENGVLVYEGEFKENMYSGRGVLYQDDIIMYSGNFSDGMFEGAGELYDTKGRLIYKGNFSLGQRSNTGIEYNAETSNKIYSGNWQQDVKEGEGVEFDKEIDNKVVYKGSFSAGLYSGQGTLYENGILKYKGKFSEGKYDGTGVMYDTVTGRVLYEGEFASGAYNGKGKEFDVETGVLIYEGSFSDGRREGNGKLYDKLGAVTYDGDFSEDDISYLNYLGKSFDEISLAFGRESFKSEIEQKLVCTYLNKNLSIVFQKSVEDDSYKCEKFLINIKKTNFKELSKNSTQENVINLFGNSYSSIKYKVANSLSLAFKSLSIDIRSDQACPTDKFLMENYMIRIYYNQDKKSLLAVEVATI